MLMMLDELVLLGMAIVFQYLMLEPRLSRFNTKLILMIGAAAVYGLNIPLFYSANAEQLNLIYPFRMVIPIFLLFAFLSKQSGFKLLFNLLTTVMLCVLTTISGFFLSVPFHYNEAVKIAGRFIAFLPLYFFVFKFFKELYFEMLQKLKKGWFLLCLIPLSISILYYYYALFEGSLEAHPENSFPILLSAVLFIVTYAVICIFFRQIKQMFELQNERQIMQAQVEALQNQAATVRESMERERIYRHDMRHYIQNIAALLHSGNYESALDYVGSLDNLFKQTKVLVYCENDTINAILHYYLEMAKQDGIEVTTRLDIPKELPVADMELATVFANAIENARNACRPIPAEKPKVIHITCVTRPRFAFEIANTYHGEVVFDADGLPVASEAGHGLGTQSIVAFTKKYGAMLDYQTDGEMFRIRILLR